MEEKKKRKKYPPKEGWKAYNEKLVRRGELMFDVEFVKYQGKELLKINRKKRGRPYDYPDSLFKFSAVLYHLFNQRYRQIEGLLKKLSILVPGLPAPDFSTPCRRFKKLDLKMTPLKNNESFVVAVDSTGVKVTNRGEWMREKHGKTRRGWIKVHIAVDVKTNKLVTLEVTDEETADCEMFKPLLEPIKKLKDVLGDGAHDTYECFEYCMSDRGIGPSGLKIREKADRTGQTDRAYAVREFQKLGYEKWKKKHKYGMRWDSEGFFSGTKRTFGESVRATSWAGMVQEVRSKFWLYNLLLTL
ncbi:MAG: IS5 family transposase [Candidatus Altiarchaeota archaeon]